MGLDHPHTKAGVGEFGVAISGGVWVAIRARHPCVIPDLIGDPGINWNLTPIKQRPAAH